MTNESTNYRVLEASFVAAGPTVEALTPPVLPEIAFAGRSNVGKSSLLNMLLQRNKLVRTSRSPGCTRTLNVFQAKLADETELGFVDLPGYGYAKISRSETKSFQAMVEGFLERRPSLVALVILVDVRRGLEAEEHELLTFMKSLSKKNRAREVSVIVCATKCDKIPRSERKTALMKIEKNAGDGVRRVIGVSAVTGDGRDELWLRMKKSLTAAPEQAARTLV